MRVSVALSSRTALPSATSIAPTANVIPDVCTSTPAGKQTTESAAGADPPQLAASLRFLFEPDPPVQVWVQVAAKAVGAELGVTATVTTRGEEHREGEQNGAPPVTSRSEVPDAPRHVLLPVVPRSVVSHHGGPSPLALTER